MSGSRFAVAALLSLTVAGCGKDSPTSPTPPASQDTRVIAITGTLDFNDVAIGSSSDRTITVRNDGNAPLSVTGISVPAGSGDAFAASWTSGTIAPNGSQPITVRFTPTEARRYDGTLRVNGNHTAGDNTRAIFATGVRTGPAWTETGTGASVFDIPTHVTRVRIEGRYTGRCENFIVRIRGRLVVNVILGTCSVADSRNYDGTHLISGGGVAEITSSSGINWTFTEVR
jgi:hypothetical protein